MVHVRALEKAFGPLKVLCGIDLTACPGQVTGLIGPNASGKTTLLKCLVGLVLPDAGEIRVDGLPVGGNPRYRERIGYMAQIARFPDNLTLRELLDLVKDLRGVPAKHEEVLLELFELKPFLPRKLGVLSGGTRQKVNAVVAMMFDPDILVLDEPTAGLDPLSARRQKDRLLEERARGKTILVTSHATGDVGELSDRVVFLLEGRVLFEGSPDELRARAGQATLERAVAAMIERNGR